jgi:hypothetical protein
MLERFARCLPSSLGAAAHQPPAREVEVRAKARAAWEAYGAGELEAVLASGAVALLDAQWLIGLADSGGVLAPRQALPAEAFLSLSEVQAATRVGWPDCLPIVCVSHCWLSPDHPDPRRDNLKRLAEALKALVRRRGRHAVLYDFCSLHQRCRDVTHCNAMNRRQRAPCRIAPCRTNGRCRDAGGNPRPRNVLAVLAASAVGRFASEEALFRQVS